VELDNDKTFYTETMARLLTDQGRYDSAAKVYRYLLDQAPHRKDLKEALDNVLSSIPEGAERWVAVSALIERWITLTLRYKTLRQLQQLPTRPTRGDRPGEWK
jgi:hypothetical protein